MRYAVIALALALLFSSVTLLVGCAPGGPRRSAMRALTVDRPVGEHRLQCLLQMGNKTVGQLMVCASRLPAMPGVPLDLQWQYSWQTQEGAGLFFNAGGSPMQMGPDPRHAAWSTVERFHYAMGQHSGSLIMATRGQPNELLEVFLWLKPWNGPSQQRIVVLDLALVGSKSHAPISFSIDAAGPEVAAAKGADRSGTEFTQEIVLARPQDGTARSRTVALTTRITGIDPVEEIGDAGLVVRFRRPPVVVLDAQSPHDGLFRKQAIRYKLGTKFLASTLSSGSDGKSRVEVHTYAVSYAFSFGHSHEDDEVGYAEGKLTIRASGQVDFNLLDYGWSGTLSAVVKDRP
jgi:hypothetical protein